jgi:DNA polymerase I-like protein with 3'-5' exonuclease and polymerase domains
MDVGRYDAQLDYLSRQIAQPLADVLDFVERMGLTLDDHYIAARSIARAYLKGAGV